MEHLQSTVHDSKVAAQFELFLPVSNGILMVSHTVLFFLTPRQVLSSHPLKQMVWLYWIQDRDRIPNWCTINDPTTLHIQWNPVTHCCWPMAFCTAGCILQMVFVSVLDTESPMVFLLVGLPHLLRLDIYYVILPQHFTTNICIKQCRKRNLPQWRAQAKMKLP